MARRYRVMKSRADRQRARRAAPPRGPAPVATRPIGERGLDDEDGGGFAMDALWGAVLAAAGQIHGAPVSLSDRVGDLFDGAQPIDRLLRQCQVCLGGGDRPFASYAQRDPDTLAALSEGTYNDLTSTIADADQA